MTEPSHAEFVQKETVRRQHADLRAHIKDLRAKGKFSSGMEGEIALLMTGDLLDPVISRHMKTGEGRSAP